MKKRIFLVVLLLLSVFALPLSASADTEEEQTVISGTENGFKWSLDTTTDTLTLSKNGNYSDSVVGDWFPEEGFCPPWYYYNISHVVVEDGITHLGRGLFSISRHHLKTVTIPSSCKYIDSEIFSFAEDSILAYLEADALYIKDISAWLSNNTYNNSLSPSRVLVSKIHALDSDGNEVTELTIPEGVETIDSFALNYFINITKITLPNSITSIGESAFRECQNLEQIEIHSRVTTIERDAFRSCKSLTNIDIPASVTSIGDSVFNNCKSLVNINVAPENENYKSVDGVLYTKDGTRLLKYGAARADESFTLPYTVEKIDDNAFEYSANLKTVNLTSNISYIPSSCFDYCTNLTSVIIPNTVTSIDSYAFYRCSSLQAISLPDSVISVDYSAFSNCSAVESLIIGKGLESLTYNSLDGLTQLKSITVVPGNAKYHSDGNCLIETVTKTLILGCSESVIPSDGSVTIIGSRAFSGSSPAEIRIPKSVTVIKSSAFSKSLEKVNYGGTEKDRELMTIESNSALLSAEWTYHVHSFGEWYTVTAESCTVAGTERRDCLTCGEYETNTLEPRHIPAQTAGKSPTCTSIGWYAYESCQRCNHNTYVEIPATGHLFLVYTSNNDAKCTENGTKTAACKNEGCSVKDTVEDIDSALGHSLTDPTCTEDSQCTRSGCSYTADNALGHNYVNYKSDGNATCTADGTETAKCERCDKYNTRKAQDSALGHDLSKATCEEAPRCQNKNCVYTEGTALGHDITEHDAKAATCTQKGWNAYEDCSRCTHSTYVEIPKLGHNYVNYTYNKNATCTADGTKTAECENCDETDTVRDEGSALGHDLSSATCTEKPTCQRTGCTYSEGNALGHRFINYISNNNATCTEDGTKTAECENCDETDTVTDEDSALGHDLSNATCTEKQKCKRTGCSYSEGNALGHRFLNYISNNNATCIADGTKSAECENCDETNTVVDVGSALGHSLSDATCTETSKCLRATCNYTIGTALGHDLTDATCTAAPICKRNDCTYTEGAALGHRFSSYVSCGDATCTSDGTKTAKCERCDETDTVTDTGSALGHDLTAATCTAAPICKRNDCTYTEGAALGHSFSSYISCGDATCIADGTKAASCERCTAVDTVADIDSALGHSYSNDCDPDCNRCSVSRTPSQHTDGNKDELCDVCNTALPKKGLSTGAIIGITAGSTVAVCTGGFSVLWFVMKKKSWADLLKLLRK